MFIDIFEMLLLVKASPVGENLGIHETDMQ